MTIHAALRPAAFVSTRAFALAAAAFRTRTAHHRVQRSPRRPRPVACASNPPSSAPSGNAPAHHAAAPSPDRMASSSSLPVIGTPGASSSAAQPPTEPEPGTLQSITFTSKFVSTLPADEQTGPEQRQVSNAAYSLVNPTPPNESDKAEEWAEAFKEGVVKVPAPPLKHELALWSESAASLIGVKALSSTQEFEKNVLGGFGALCEGMKPYAACYGGHQFGAWAKQLGDGRAITLGEAGGWEVQLKGAGRTPYSRFADGRAVLRSSVREFLCSESMFALGVPTTRALALVTTGAGVVRDMFYAGEPQLEPGAVCTRLAPSFLRIGSFQLPASRQEFKLLTELADYAIENHFPEIAEQSSSEEDFDYVEFVREVSRLNAVMVAQWMGVGFVHGVMNTDNFSILGLTIDYGPYGFLDAYDPEYTPNTTDEALKRYKYADQPIVARWNILQFAQAMVPLTNVAEMQNVVDEFENIYQRERNALFAKKLGVPCPPDGTDVPLLEELLELMKASAMDWTNTWRAMSKITSNMKGASVIEKLVADEKLFEGRKKSDVERCTQWVQAYIDLITENENSGALSADDRVRIMDSVNPVYILRNYMAQIGIEKAENNDYSEIERLHTLLANPYTVQSDMEKYTREPPDWAAKRGVKVNSCSS